MFQLTHTGDESYLVSRDTVPIGAIARDPQRGGWRPTAYTRTATLRSRAHYADRQAAVHWIDTARAARAAR